MKWIGRRGKGATRSELLAQPQREREVCGLTFSSTLNDYNEWAELYGDQIPTLEEWRKSDH